MPMLRYRIRNEYAVADPEVYRAANKDDPEALLEGVAMAGLVGVLRQLGDLSEFAAEIIHDLHEEVMATSARGHELMLRVQQIEAEFPLVEKVLFCRTDYSHCAYNAGIDWHSNLRVNQNLVTRGDMPRFILESYEECRGPPSLFMLDKFDIGGADACLKRYSDPSYFKTHSATFLMMEPEIHREKRAPKLNKKGSHCRSSKSESFFTPIIDNSQLTASEQVIEKYPTRHVKLKHRNFIVSDISKQSYMKGILEEKSLEENDLEKFLTDSHIMTSINSDSWEVLNGGATAPSVVRKEVLPFSPRAEAIVETEQNNFLASSGLILYDDHEGYRSDDIGSELENYVNALNTMESELETDSERTKLDPGFFNSKSRGTDPAIDGNLELQTQSAGSGFVGSLKSGKIKDEIHNLSESTTSAGLTYQPLREETVFEATSWSEINQFKTGKLEKTGEDMKLVPLSYLTYYEACYPKQSNITILVPTSGVASSSSCMMDSTFIDCLDIPSDVLEEINPTEHSEGKISDKVDMPCDPSEIEDGTLSGKVPALFFNDSTLDLKDDGRGRLSRDLAKKTSSNYLEGSDEVNKQLDSSLQCPVDRGDSEKIISVETSTTFLMPEPSQEQAESFFLGILTVVEDTSHDSMEGNETYSVDQLSPKSSAFSLEIVSSIFQSESLTTEVKNISMSEEELVHPQSPASSRNVDVEECEPTISSAIAFELEHSSDAEEAQESAVIDLVEPLPSGCGEDPNALQLQPKDLKLIEKNGKTHVSDSNAGKVITTDGLHGQVLHILQSATVSCFDVHSLKDLISQTDTSCQPNPDIEELAMTRDSAFSLSQNKPFVPFALNEDLEIFDDKLVYVNVDDILVELHPSLEGDNICSRENNQDSDSKYENVIPEDGTTVKVLSLLQSSKGCSFDLNILRDPFSDDAALNQYKLESDKSEIADSNSKSENKITEDGTHGEYHSLLQSLDVSRLDAQLQENHVSEDSSLNQHKQELVILCDHGCNSRLSVPSSRIDKTKQTKSDLFDPFQDITEYPRSSIAYVALTSESPLVADFIIPNSLISAREPFEAFADEMISRFQIQEDNEEAPPPLPPLQWRIVKPRLESLVASEHIAQPVEKTNPCLRQNTGKQKKSSFVTLSAPKERFQQVSSSTDGMLESVKLPELSLIATDLRQQLQIRSPEIKTVHSSDQSLIMSSDEDGKHADGNVAMNAENTFTIPLIKDQMPQDPDLLEAGNLEETRQKLVKFLASFELEGLQEAPIIDRDAMTPLNSFPVMSTTRDNNCQYIYGDYGGYEGEGVQHQNFSGPSPIAVQVSELGWPLTEPPEDERNYLLEQIKNKSFNLKPASSAKPNILKTHSTNLKVVAILEKVNTIRQACVGSDEDDDNWSDS